MELDILILVTGAFLHRCFFVPKNSAIYTADYDGIFKTINIY